MAKNLIFGEGFRKWIYNISRWNQLGLYYDDIQNPYRPDVIEAVRRLPQHLKDERNFRSIRAMQLNCQKEILPKDQWTKYEDDMANRYLKPYLDEVRAEIREKEEWDKE